MKNNTQSTHKMLPAVRLGDQDIILSSDSLELGGIPLPISSFLNSDGNEPVCDLRVATSAADLAHTINPGEAYTIIVDNKDAWLAQVDPNTGTYPSVVRGSKGKILEHPEWKRVGPDMAKAAKAVGMQVLLVSIAIKINEIDKKITGVIHGLHNDRIAEIEGGINQLRTALTVENAETRNLELAQAAQTFQTAIPINIRSLIAEIESCSSERTGFFDAWAGDGLNEARKKMALAQESAQILSQGMQGLYLCYALRSPAEIGAATGITRHNLREILGKINFTRAHEKIALTAGGERTQSSPLFWRDLHGQFEYFYNRLSNLDALSTQPMCVRLER